MSPADAAREPTANTGHNDNHGERAEKRTKAGPVSDAREPTANTGHNDNHGERAEKRTKAGSVGGVGGVSDVAAPDGDADRISFEDFVATRLQALLRYGRLLTGNTTSAEDLVQTALAKSYPKWGRIEAADPEGYVRRTMVNTHASWWRRPFRERPYEQLPERPTSNADPYTTIEQREAVWQALSGLSARQRTALVLRFYEDMSMVEIADTLGCRTGTAKSLVSRGLATLRQATGLRDGDMDELDGGDREGPSQGDRRGEST